MDTNTTNEGEGKVMLMTKNKFPVSLRVLLVDDDRTSLQVWGRMLQACGYQVTKCLRAEDALVMLRSYRSRFDILISDLHMPGMDGFKLLQIIGLEMADLPVIVISSDDDYNTIQKGIINGACDFLVKPIPMEALKMVWKYVVCKRRMKLEEVQKQQQQQLWNVGHYYGDVHLRLPYRDHPHNILPLNEGIKRLKRGTDGDEDECKASGDHDHVVGAKKSRMIWTADLHHKFVAIVNELGLKRAVPKKILERMQAMGVPNLTREKVASHLQKYRIYLQKQKDDARQKTDQHLAPLRRPQEIPPLGPTPPHTFNHDAQMINTYPNHQLDLLTQFQRARTVRSIIRSSQLNNIVTAHEGFQNLLVPVEAHHGQNKPLTTTQMADDQTPTSEQIWNEIKGADHVAAKEIDGSSTCTTKCELPGLHDIAPPPPPPLHDTSGDFSFFFKNNALRRSSGDCGLLLNEYTLFRDNSEDYSSLWNEICPPSQG